MNRNLNTKREQTLRAFVRTAFQAEDTKRRMCAWHGAKRLIFASWNEPGAKGQAMMLDSESLIMQSIKSDGQDLGLYFKCDRKPRSYKVILGLGAE